MRRIFGKVINEIASKDKPIFITGHSLGGALANLFAIKLEQKE